MPTNKRGSKPTRSRPPARGKGKASARRSFLWRFRRGFFLLGLLLVAGAAGAGWVLAQVPLPPEQFQAQTTFIYDAGGDVIAELHGGEDRVTVPLDEVPDVLVEAVLAVEDRDFFIHGGISPQALVRATWADIRGRPLQGGSTVTQQYVKNVYVGTDRTLARKLREAVIAVKLERQLDKRQILERYLNTIYFGRGAYGVKTAAETWFGKDLSEIDVPEAAYLAGLIRAPETGDATRNPDEADRRRNLTLVAMEQMGHIDTATRQRVAAMPVTSYVRERSDKRDVDVVAAAACQCGLEYFVEYVRRQLTATYGDQVVYGGGLRVSTTIDLRLQKAAYDAVYGTLDREDDPAGALVALDDGGSIRAMVGGRDFEASKVNLAVGRQGGGTGRQPGSAFKPFVLAEAVREGYSVESAFESPARIVIPRADAGSDWEVRNYANTAHGRINLIEATQVSSNTVYAQLMDTIGPPTVAALAGRMGITTDLPPEVSLALGAGEVSVLDMADAYLTLATRGVHLTPVAVTRVANADGSVRAEHGPRRERVLDPEHADVVTFALRQVVERGTGTNARFGKPVAGKTGTTQDSADAWFVGYTPTMSVAVWMGHPGSNEPMGTLRGAPVTGGGLPASIFRQFMRVATDGVATGDFVTPRSFPGRVLNTRQPYVDPDSTTTTTEAPATTTTEAPDDEGTEETTTTSSTTTTTAPPETTTTTSSTTTTTAPPETTTTTTAPEGRGPVPAP